MPHDYNRKAANYATSAPTRKSLTGLSGACVFLASDKNREHAAWWEPLP